MIQENEKATIAVSGWNGTPLKTDEQSKRFATFLEKESLQHEIHSEYPESGERFSPLCLRNEQEVDFLRI
jgi:hypothetical protein